MKRILLLIIALLLISTLGYAADKNKALFAIETARTSVAKLEQRGATDPLVTDDIAAAKGYLNKAETLYKENISWLLLGNLNDAAEPQVLNFTEMASIAADIGLAKLEKNAQKEEALQLEKEVAAAKNKIKVFEDRATEVAKLKTAAGQYDVASQTIATLKAQVELYKADKLAADKLRQDKADLQKQLSDTKAQVATLTGQLETLKMEKASMGGQIAALNADKSVTALQVKKLNERIVALETESVSLIQKKDEAVKSGKQLDSLNRSVTFRTELSKLGAITDISDSSVTLVLPRTDLLYTTSRSYRLSRNADKNMKELLALIPRYPEYAFSLKVFGFGKPTRVEGKKPADAMAKIARDYLALKLGVKADSIAATGGTAPSPLFPAKARESNKRIEITFSLRDIQK